MGGPGSGRRKRIEGITTPKYPACEKTSSYTPIKQKKFEAILKTHLWIVRNIQRQPKFKNFGKEGFAYFDLMAGPGKCPKFEGSPLIALRCLKEILGTADIGYEVVFIEEDKPSYYELCKNVKEAYPKLEGVIGSETTEYTSESFCVTIERGRWEETLPEYKVLESKKMHLALIYLDPAGTRPTWQLIQDLTKREDYKTVDWLIDCPAAKEKRRGGLLKNPKFNFNYIRLATQLQICHKNRWLIGDHYGAPQWTFMLATNFNGKGSGWKSQGLYDIRSDKGKKLLKEINLTKEELASDKEYQILKKNVEGLGGFL